MPMRPAPFCEGSALQGEDGLGPSSATPARGAGAGYGYAQIKRLLDIVISGTLIVLLAPLMMLAALWIRLDSPGPALYRQRRAGLNGAAFTVLKFRTMSVRESGRRRPRGACLQMLLRTIQPPDDSPEITRAGRLLRRTRLDELPQLFNVLAGDMSLVGPRPHMFELDAAFSHALPQITARRAAPPGLTGLAQVNGRIGATPDVATMAARLADDLAYIRRRSLLLDLRILALTPLCLMRAQAQASDGCEIRLPFVIRGR